MKDHVSQNMWYRASAGQQTVYSIGDNHDNIVNKQLGVWKSDIDKETCKQSIHQPQAPSDHLDV